MIELLLCAAGLRETGGTRLQIGWNREALVGGTLSGLLVLASVLVS